MSHRRDIFPLHWLPLLNESLFGKKLCMQSMHGLHTSIGHCTYLHKRHKLSVVGKEEVIVFLQQQLFNLAYNFAMLPWLTFEICLLTIIIFHNKAHWFCLATYLATVWRYFCKHHCISRSTVDARFDLCNSCLRNFTTLNSSIFTVGKLRKIRQIATPRWI